ncbi:DUF1549 and DUF1553 domain-containing protein [Stieleria sp. JC731]|uniref:DUF1549 domain-containing protein n=1 Tax=Stieleria sp. JC731 TaxID=2894195 RepID=UPI001E3247EC|nr:DUF1549 domain-containing protein [Stieleria sp. JC731]MCC9601739.1 DUF1549 and DUF1553 domain-containing protein [Stieleria sp. JC731]
MQFASCPVNLCAQATVALPRTDFDDPTATVDRFIDAKLTADERALAKRSDDAEFCRRVWLDLAGVAPPIWELREFLADRDVEKRTRLIDRLIASPRFASHMATRFTHSILPSDSEAIRGNDSDELREWLRRAFVENKPYDHMVGAFLTAGGATDSGPAIFYTSRDADPVKVAAATSRLFLGIRIDCAQCHDHPFADWTQDDFWSFAAFFSQLQVDSQNGSSATAIEDRIGKELTYPESDRIAEPRYLGVDEIPEPDPGNLRRRQLTIWLASRSNPYFARAAVNRVWAHLFGRGIINPIDELDSMSLATHPELLEYLSEYFTQTRFDLTKLYRVIAKTNAYQRTSQTESSRPAIDSYALMLPKTLSAEQYFDTIAQNVIRQRFDGSIESERGEQLRRLFVQRMRNSGATPLEYPHGVVQALGMMNGPEMMSATANENGLLASIEAPFYDDSQRIEALFLACVSRKPTSEEAQRFTDYLNDASIEATRQERLGDLVWVLANSAECFSCP